MVSHQRARLRVWFAVRFSHYDDREALNGTEFGRHALHDADHEDEEDANAAAILGTLAPFQNPFEVVSGFCSQGLKGFGSQGSLLGYPGSLLGYPGSFP